MLKRIVPSEVRLGMYVQAFDGRWLSHPFWRSRFHITDYDDLRRVQASKVAAVIIDDQKGIAPDIVAKSAAVPVCVADDGVPGAIANPSVARQWATVLPDRDMQIFTRYVAGDVDASASTRADRIEIARVIGESARLVRQTFDGVARGHVVSLDGLGKVADAISVAMGRNRRMMIGISRLKSKDEYTFFHSVAVGALMVGMARELGLEEAIVRDLALGGLLHDIGKMHVDPEVLNKPGKLTAAEFEEMKRHPELGHRILSMAGAVAPIALEVTLRHHERLDGTGYPDGLVGDAVSIHARIAGICDVFDALTSARIYRDAMPAHEAITMMAGWEGQFDRGLLIIFMQSIGIYPTGLLVRLSSQRLAIMLPPVRRAGRARARIFHCAVSDTPLLPCDVVITEDGPGERVVAEEHAEGWSIGDWAKLRAQLLEMG